MSDNWLALAIAVLSPKEISIGMSLRKAGIKIQQHKNHIEIDEKQFNKIKKLRDNKVSWKDITRQMGYKCAGQALRDKFYRILAKKRTAKTPTKVVSAAK